MIPWSCPVVSIQLGWLGSRCATTMRTTPSGSETAVAWFTEMRRRLSRHSAQMLPSWKFQYAHTGGVTSMTSASSGPSSHAPSWNTMFGSPPTSRWCSGSGKCSWLGSSRHGATQSANQLEAPIAYIAAPRSCRGTALGHDAGRWFVDADALDGHLGRSFGVAVRERLTNQDHRRVGRELQPVARSLVLAGDDLETAVGVELEVVVVEVAGAASDAVARRIVLVLGREAQVRDRSPRAGDAVVELRIDAGARVHVVGVVEAEAAVRRQRREVRVTGTGVLEERRQPVLEQTAEIAQPLGAIEVGEAQVVACNRSPACSSSAQNSRHATCGSSAQQSRSRHQRGRISVPIAGGDEQRGGGPASTSAVCQTPGGFTIA